MKPSLMDIFVLIFLFITRVGLPVLFLFLVGNWLRSRLDVRPRTPALVHRLEQTAKRLPPDLIPGAVLLTLLWIVALGATLARMFWGLGAVTNLSDNTPWGLWIGFDVLCGVALAAGGFTMAGTVYVFRLERFRPLVRPAILTAFLGYLMVILALIFDLGRWYYIWHALIMWNPHSVMFEVAWCVMTYTTILALEFSIVVFEKLKWHRLVKIMHAITLPLVIVGMVLSTLHQSSLGSLFLIVPHKLSALWYTPILPINFFVSAVAVGLGMVIVESTLSARGFKRPVELPLLSDLGKAAAVVLGIYLAIKLADVTLRGAWAQAFVPGLPSLSFWLEIILGVVIPMILFANRRVRASDRGLFRAAALVVGGVVLNRLNVSLIGWIPTGNMTYVPSVGEIIITFSLVLLGVATYAFIARVFPIFQQVGEPVHALSEVTSEG